MHRYTVYFLKVRSSRPEEVQSRPDARAAHFMHVRWVVVRAPWGLLFLLYDKIWYITIKTAVSTINSVNLKKDTEKRETNECISMMIQFCVYSPES